MKVLCLHLGKLGYNVILCYTKSILYLLLTWYSQKCALKDFVDNEETVERRIRFNGRNGIIHDPKALPKSVWVSIITPELLHIIMKATGCLSLPQVSSVTSIALDECDSRQADHRDNRKSPAQPIVLCFTLDETSILGTHVRIYILVT